MTQSVAIGLAAIAGALVLVVPALIARNRAGHPIARYAAMWAAVFALAFAGALLTGYHGR